MKASTLYRYTESGFSLVELIVVIGVIGILLSIVSINFNSWLVKNRVEAQVREMATDFSELRVKAFTNKQRHSITINKQSYVFKSYSSENELQLSGGTVLPAGTHTVQFPLKKSSGADFDGIVIEIETRGMSTSTKTSIYLDYQNASPNIDCLTIHTMRINPGKKNGSNCDDM